MSKIQFFQKSALRVRIKKNHGLLPPRQFDSLKYNIQNQKTDDYIFLAMSVFFSRMSPFLDYAHLPSFACAPNPSWTLRIWVTPLLKKFYIYHSNVSWWLTQTWRTKLHHIGVLFILPTYTLLYLILVHGGPRLLISGRKLSGYNLCRPANPYPFQQNSISL